jgi:hypothetical protein
MAIEDAPDMDSAWLRDQAERAIRDSTDPVLIERELQPNFRRAPKTTGIKMGLGAILRVDGRAFLYRARKRSWSVHF